MWRSMSNQCHIEDTTHIQAGSRWLFAVMLQHGQARLTESLEQMPEYFWIHIYLTQQVLFILNIKWSINVGKKKKTCSCIIRMTQPPVETRTHSHSSMFTGKARCWRSAVQEDTWPCDTLREREIKTSQTKQDSKTSLQPKTACRSTFNIRPAFTCLRFGFSRNVSGRRTVLWLQSWSPFRGEMVGAAGGGVGGGEDRVLLLCLQSHMISPLCRSISG